MSNIAKIDNADRLRLEKCLAMAFSSTDDTQVLSAIKSARNVVRKYEVSLIDFFQSMRETSSDTRVALSVTEQAHSATVEKDNERLKRQLSETQERLAKAETALTNVVVAPPAAVNAAEAQNGFYRYDVFYSALISHLGTPKRALSIFSEMTSTPAGRIQSWRRTDKVPEAAYKAIAGLVRGQAILHQHQPLTAEHRRRIDRLCVEGKSDADIAETMNIEFGDRTFNVNMIKGAKTQIRAAYLDDLKFDGKTKEEARKALLARYPSVRAVDSLLDRVYANS